VSFVVNILFFETTPEGLSKISNPIQQSLFNRIDPSAVPFLAPLRLRGDFIFFGFPEKNGYLCVVS
jgi:hypothetical protein